MQFTDPKICWPKAINQYFQLNINISIESKRGRGYEKLTQCVTYSSAEQLSKLVESTSDKYTKSQLLGLSVQCIVAKEFSYHELCYKLAT